MATDKSRSNFAIWISLISNIFLMFLKLAVGFLFHSQVLIADGVHNAGDVIASTAAFISMQISKKPADADHPYGHGKAEVLSSGLVALILGLAALFIAFESIKAFFEPPSVASGIAFLAGLISLVWKQALYSYTIRIGEKVRSKGLIATANDHLADVYASIAVVFGIGLALIGDYFKIEFLAYGDPFAGIIVSIFIMKLVIRMALETIDILMEKNVSEDKQNQYVLLIQSISQVKSIDRLRAREHGHYILVDARVSVPGDLTVKEGHDISRLIRNKIIENHPDVDEVLVHLNPWYSTENSRKSEN
jgi:cation diffusion facilitator family transporter